jgi:hypothetical protein
MPGSASSLCDGVGGNLVSNCGFEGGIYSSTLDGNTNGSVPISWVANAGFDAYAGYDFVTGYANSGSHGLSIGNDDSEPVPALSQALSDAVGTTYNGSLYVSYGGAGTSDTNPFFDVLIDGAPVLSLTYQAAPVFTEYTFSFVGTGSDTLTLEGNTSPSEWYADDVVITAGASAVPEPGSAFLMAAGGAFLFLRRRLARQ